MFNTNSYLAYFFMLIIQFSIEYISYLNETPTDLCIKLFFSWLINLKAIERLENCVYIHKGLHLLDNSLTSMKLCYI